MSRMTPRGDDQTHVTDITIQPDGRIYVFGTSRPILDVLKILQPRDGRLKRLCEHVSARWDSEPNHGAINGGREIKR